MKIFKNRTIGFYLGLCAAAVSLISGILFMIIRIGDADESFFLKSNDAFLITAIILLIAGGLSFALTMFTDFKFAPMIPVALYSIALGAFFYCAMFQLSDLFTGIAFFGGNAGFAIAFLIVFALCGVAGVISCFMEQKKVIA